MLLAYVRGVTREVIALMSWVLGFFAAVAFSPLVGAMLPDFGGQPVVRYLVAFALILIAALVLGALVAWPLSSVIRKSGLGFVDRFLGAVFGIARGAVLVARVRALRRTDHASQAGLVAEFRPCPAADGRRARSEAVAAAGMGRSTRLLPRGPHVTACPRGQKGVTVSCAASSASSRIRPSTSCCTTACCCCSTAARTPRASSPARARSSTCTRARDSCRTCSARATCAT